MAVHSHSPRRNALLAITVVKSKCCLMLSPKNSFSDLYNFLLEIPSKPFAKDMSRSRRRSRRASGCYVMQLYAFNNSNNNNNKRLFISEAAIFMLNPAYMYHHVFQAATSAFTAEPPSLRALISRTHPCFRLASSPHRSFSYITNSRTFK